MSAATARSLTQRQLAVMERIDRRMPIKVIAQELGVSETRINQHIRALKDFYEAESLTDLVENHRSTIETSKAPKSIGARPAIPLANAMRLESRERDEKFAGVTQQVRPIGPEESAGQGGGAPIRSLPTVAMMAIALALIAMITSLWVI